MIRPAVADDLPAIAALHTASWRGAYRGMLPDDFLDGALADVHRRQWGALPPLAFVAEADGALTGFVAGWPEDAGVYVDNLHVAARARGLGLARDLMGRMAGACPPDGRLRLTVILGNRPARAAYAAMGGAEGTPFGELCHGHPVEVVEVAWTGAALARLAVRSAMARTR